MPGTFEDNTSGMSWCEMSLVNGHFSELWDHSFDAVWWFSAVSDNCMRFLFAKTLRLSPVPFQGGSGKRRLESVSTLFCNELFGVREVTTVFFIFGIPWVSWCEGHCMSVFTTFSPSGDEAGSQLDLRSNDQPLWSTNSFQLWGMKTWPIVSRSIVSPREWPWMARMYNNFHERSQHWNLVLLHPFQM